MEILDRRRLVALLGNPGSGKTSLLKYLVLRWVFDDRRHLPLWIDLKEYGRQPMGLKKYLESGQSSFGLDARGIEEQLGDGTAAMYLDGLDEIFSKQIRSSVIEELAAFSAHYPKAPVIITSRIVGYEPDRLREVGFVHATLEDFDDSQVLAFLEKWHAAAEPEDLKERARLQTQIRRAISESRPIRELAGNPLLLT
jgi:predicted NACHT family NTPase